MKANHRRKTDKNSSSKPRVPPSRPNAQIIPPNCVVTTMIVLDKPERIKRPRR